PDRPGGCDDLGDPPRAAGMVGLDPARPASDVPLYLIPLAMNGGTHMTRVLSIAAAVAVMVASLGIFASPAAAHERRVVGPYTFVVGWITEPSFVGQLNALDLTVTDTASTKAVEGLEKTLKADLITGGGAAVMPLAIAARFGLPGKYQGLVLPT